MGGTRAASQPLCLHKGSPELGELCQPSRAGGWHSLPRAAAWAQQEKLGCCSGTEILLRISKSPSDHSRASLLSARAHQNYCQAMKQLPNSQPGSQCPAPGPQHSFHPTAEPIFPQDPISPKCLTEFWPGRCKTSVGCVIFQSYDN